MTEPSIPIILNGEVEYISYIPKELFDITDLTKVLGLGRNKICELRDSGDLEMTTLGGKYVITRKKLDEFLEKIDSGELYIKNELL